MTAKRLALSTGKKRCDRCRQEKPPVHECRFSFPEGYAHWKSLWQARTGRRLTNRRKRKLLDQEDTLDLTALSKVSYWMDLCDECWEECSTAKGEGFPSDFWEAVLSQSLCLEK